MKVNTSSIGGIGWKCAVWHYNAGQPISKFRTRCTRPIQAGWSEILFTAAWWRHKMETFSVLLSICAGNSPVTDEFPSQRPVTGSFDVFFITIVDHRVHPGKCLVFLSYKLYVWNFPRKCRILKISDFAKFISSGHLVENTPLIWEKTSLVPKCYTGL